VIHCGPPRRTLRLGPQYDVRRVPVSPDGRWVVTGSHWPDDSGVKYKVWQADTGRLVANLPTSEVTSFAGFSPDSRWLYVSGKEYRRLEIASLTRTPLQPAAPAAPDRPAWQEGWRSERIRTRGHFSPDNRLAAFGSNEGSIRLVLVETDEEIAQLPAPEVGHLGPSGFSPDGTLLMARGQETGALYVFDLRRIRTQLAELGLDWDLPSYPPRPEDSNPVLAPPLQVELVGAEAASSAAKMAEYETRKLIARLERNPRDVDAHYLLGVRLLDAGKPRTAHAHLSTALGFCPDLDLGYYHRARASVRLGRWQEVVADTSRCLRKYPFDSNARRLRVDAYRVLNRYDEVVADLTVLIKAYPLGNAALYELRASCYAALGKPERAKADRDQAIKRGGGALTRNNQAWHLVTGPAGQRDPVKALQLIQEAVKATVTRRKFASTGPCAGGTGRRACRPSTSRS
jgi:hypothetical protein